MTAVSRLAALWSALAMLAIIAQPHDDVFAVICSTSRYWFNYRHTANALLVYRSLRRLGLPDSRIVLMLADEHAASAQNVAPGTVFGTDSSADELYGGRWWNGTQTQAPAHVSYVGLAVTAATLLAVLGGRTPPSLHVGGDAGGSRPHSLGVGLPTGLATDLASAGAGRGSRLLVYLTGHGGDGFLKAHDKEEVAAGDLGRVIRGAQAAGRYGDVLLLLDTCQAATLAQGYPATQAAAEVDDASAAGVMSSVGRDLRQLAAAAVAAIGLDASGLLVAKPSSSASHMPAVPPAPGLVAVASSYRAQNSYAYGSHPELGQSVADGFTLWLSRGLADAAAASALLQGPQSPAEAATRPLQPRVAPGKRSLAGLCGTAVGSQRRPAACALLRTPPAASGGRAGKAVGTWLGHHTASGAVAAHESHLWSVAAVAAHASYQHIGSTVTARVDSMPLLQLLGVAMAADAASGARTRILPDATVAAWAERLPLAPHAAQLTRSAVTHLRAVRLRHMCGCLAAALLEGEFNDAEPLTAIVNGSNACRPGTTLLGHLLDADSSSATGVVRLCLLQSLAAVPSSPGSVAGAGEAGGALAFTGDAPTPPQLAVAGEVLGAVPLTRFLVLPPPRL